MAEKKYPDIKKSKGTISSRKSNCLRVEQFEGNLDIHFKKDKCFELINKLTYTKEDSDHNRKQKHKIPIEGNIFNRTSTLKQAVNLYIEFKNSNLQNVSQSKFPKENTNIKKNMDKHNNSVKMEIFQKENIQNEYHYILMIELANELFNFMNKSEIIQKINETHKINTQSGEIQEIFLEKLIRLGFNSEKKGLFSKYETSGLRPDYYKKLGTKEGIIVEVERGKTIANNMDILDLWKCHICDEANYLFLIVPQFRQKKNNSKDNIYEIVIKRIKSFFIQNNYINVDAVVIFGY